MSLTLPPRQKLIDWGLVPCRGHDCRVLVNAEVAGDRFCKRCRTRRPRRR
jgi:hypothetical protein